MGPGRGFPWEKNLGRGMGGVTLCRPRQCSSATNWWKFPSVTFSVSSKDSRGFCSGKEVLIPQTPQPQPLRACTPPTATEPAPTPQRNGKERRGEASKM